MKKPISSLFLGILLISCVNLLPPQQSERPAIRRIADYGFLEGGADPKTQSEFGPSATPILFDLGVDGTLVVTTEAGEESEQASASAQTNTQSGATFPAITILVPTSTLSSLPSTTQVSFPTFAQNGSNPTNTPIPTWTSTRPSVPTPTFIPTSTTASTNTPIPSATKTNPPPQPSNTPVPQTCNPSGNASFENQVLDLINQERANQGLAPLTLNNKLTSAARGHSQDMACNDFFSHTSPTTGSPFDRILAAGYSYSWAAENIAAGYGSPQDTVAGWMNSSGHRANILASNYVHIGIGYAYWGDSTYGSYWTAVFAAP